MDYDFEIGGKLNAESLDDACDILRITLEDNGARINKFVIQGRYKSVSICKKK